jgi:hypothetical protein
VWVVWAVGVVGLLFALAGLLTLDPKPCDGHLKRVKPNATHLAQNLNNFDSFCWAFENDEFLDGTFISSAEAMEQLLFRFTRFFSAAWVYEDHCRDHGPHEEVVDWLREVYKALGEPKKGESDERVTSDQLHAIGEAGTSGWGTDQVRAKSREEMKDVIPGDLFSPLKRLLDMAADENSDARARLRRTLEALERVRDRLTEKRY